MEIKDYYMTLKPVKDGGINASGFDKIAFVDDPAIEEMGVYMSEDNIFIDLSKYMVELSKVDDEKMRVLAPLLIPDKKIKRQRNDGSEYNIIFTKETIKDILEDAESKGIRSRDDIFKNTHRGEKAPAYVLDIWIVEDENDMIYSEYGFKPVDVPVGSLMVLTQITDEDFWIKEIKMNNKYGYSIEAFLNMTENLELVEVDLAETYNDYPKAATENAKTALRWVEENGWGSCGTDVGKARAHQLAKGENISRDTIARMAAFERHRQNSQKDLGDGCGRLMWLAWGGDAGIEWAQRKLKQIDKEKLSTTESTEKINMSMDDLKLPTGEHLIGDKIYIIDEEGSLVEIKEVETEVEAEVEAEVEVEAETEVEVEAEEHYDKVEAETEVEVETEEHDEKSELEKYKDEVEVKMEELYEQIAEIKAEIERGKENKVEMSVVKEKKDLINAVSKFKGVIKIK